MQIELFKLSKDHRMNDLRNYIESLIENNLVIYNRKKLFLNEVIEMEDRFKVSGGIVIKTYNEMLDERMG